MSSSSHPMQSDGPRSLGILLVVALLSLVVLRSTEIPSAIDAALRAAYYRVGTTSQTTQRVLLVEADDDTVRAWGDPAWSDERRRDLLGRIAAGGPAAMVILDRARMFPSASPGADALPDGTPVVELEPRIDPASSAVDSLDRADVSLASLHPVLRALDLPPRPREPLRIHYLTPVSRLPTVAFHRVAQGDVPASIFQDKVVVVGLTSLTHRDPLATPVGALTTPEIFSHALAMLADQRQAYEPSWPVRALGLVGLLAIMVLVLRQATPAQALLRTMGIVAVLVLADLLAFTSHVACWGVAHELLLVLTALLVYWYLAQRNSAELVKTMSVQVTEQVVEHQPASGPSEWFWRDMAELVRAYLDLEVTAVIAELPPGRWHLEPRAFMNMTEADIFERRRDVRRPPYRAAFLTQRAARCDRRFVADEGRYTIAVPLAHQGRMLGMWMVSLPNGVELEAVQLEALEQLGVELGRSIAEARRAEQEARSVLDTDDVTSRLSRLLSGMEALGEDKQRILDTFEALPLGLLIADMWGHVLQQNPAFQQQLAHELPDGIPNHDLCAVLSRITGSTIEGVHALMRSAVREGRTLHLRMPRATGRPATYLLMPMRTGGNGDSHAAGGAATRLVLIAVPDVLREAMDAALAPREPAPAVVDAQPTTPATIESAPATVESAPATIESAPATIESTPATIAAPPPEPPPRDPTPRTPAEGRRRRRRRKRNDPSRGRNDDRSPAPAASSPSEPAAEAASKPEPRMLRSA